MHITDTFRRSSRSLKSAKGRTILTALAIAVGGFTLTITLAAGNGIGRYTKQLISSNLDPAELIVARDKDAFSFGGSSKPKEFEDNISSIAVGGNGASMQFKQVTDKDAASLRAMPFAEQVRESYSLSMRYITRPGTRKYTGSIEAYNPSQKPQVVAGKIPSSGDLPTGQIVLPEDYIELLGFKNKNDAIGKTVSVNIGKTFSVQSVLAQFQVGGSITADSSKLQPTEQSNTYKVVAVSTKPATTLAAGTLSVLLGSKDARMVYDYESKDTADYGKYLAVLVHVKDGANDTKLEAAKTTLEQKGYYVRTSKDIQATLNQVVQIFTILVGVFGVITLIASVFGIVNTQYISVLERTREIGLMKSLGMRSRDVRRLFIFEAAWIGFIGGIIGTIGGIAVALSLNPTINRKWGIEFIFRPLQVIALIVVLILIAIVAGFLPARKAARLDPIEALRTE